MRGALSAYKILVFSGQFDLTKDFAYHTKELLLKHEKELQYSKWYSYVWPNVPLIYFYPVKSNCDLIQAEFLAENKAILGDSVVAFPMKSHKHGVMVNKKCLSKIMELSMAEISNMRQLFEFSSKISPFFLSVKLIGVQKSLKREAYECLVSIFKAFKCIIFRYYSK